jgi:hypothetical protein
VALFKGLLVLFDGFGGVFVFDCGYDCSVVLVETVQIELFAKFIFLVVNVQKGFDDVRESNGFGFGVHCCDVVFGVGPNSFFGDVSDFPHQFSEYFGLGAGHNKIVHELLPSDCIPMKEDRVGGSRSATAEGGLFRCFSLH